MSNKYRFQICLNKGTERERWADVHPAGKPNEPYEYATYEEAEHKARLCHGLDHEIVRITHHSEVQEYINELPEIHDALRAWFTLPIDDAGTPYVPTERTRK